MRLDLNPDEARFLYQLLDRVNVSGPEAKTLLLSIMSKLVQVTMPSGDKEEPIRK
jgi:hypothetical protein